MILILCGTRSLSDSFATANCATLNNFKCHRPISRTVTGNLKLVMLETREYGVIAKASDLGKRTF